MHSVRAALHLPAVMTAKHAYKQSEFFRTSCGELGWGSIDSLAQMDCEGESCPWIRTLNDTWRSQAGLLCCDATGVRYMAKWVESQSEAG